MLPFVKSNVILNGIPLTMLTHREDKVVGELLRSRQVSGQVLDYLKMVIKPRSRVLDAGANIGSTAIFLAKLQPTATIYSFEPDPLNYSLMNLNITLNAVPNVYPFNYALGTSERFIELYRNTVNHGDHRSSKPLQTDADASIFRPLPMPVLMVNPASFFRRLMGTQAPFHFDLLKIDAQGADFNILNACLPLIRQDSTVVVEYSPYHLYRNSTSREDVENVAKQFSSMEIITPMSHSKRTELLTMEQLLSSYDAFSKEWKGHSDLVFTHFNP